jgi:tetratricopeptide (TPR) repeat protein
VLVDEYGYAVITDFGLAASVAEAIGDAAEALALVEALAAQDDGQAAQTAGQRAAAHSTRTTHYQSKRTRRGGWGTMAYMPPEQWEDEEVGTPADLYAFGLILSELLAGRHGLVDLEEALDQEGWYRLHKSGTPRPLRTGPAEGASRLPQEAEDLYERLLSKRAEQRPTAAEALSVLQQVAQQLGEDPYIVPEIAPRTDANRVAKWANWAGTYHRFNRYEEALARNERALEIDPNHLNALIIQGSILGELGLAAMRAGRIDEGRRQQEASLACVDKALEVTPPDDAMHRKMLYNTRGVTLSQMGRYAEAEADYAESLRLAPERANTWNNRANNALRWGEAEARAGRKEEARRLFQAGLSQVEQAERYQPNSVITARRRADLQQALRDL